MYKEIPVENLPTLDEYLEEEAPELIGQEDATASLPPA